MQTERTQAESKCQVADKALQILVVRYSSKLPVHRQPNNRTHDGWSPWREWPTLQWAWF